MQKTAQAIPQRTLPSSSAQVFRSQAVPPLVRRVPAPVSASRASVNIRYLEQSPIRVRGTVSGRHYDFSGAHPIQSVDDRDASWLLNTRFFRRA